MRSLCCVVVSLSVFRYPCSFGVTALGQSCVYCFHRGLPFFQKARFSFRTFDLQLSRATCNTLLLCLTRRSSLHLSFLAVHVHSPLLQGWEYVVLHGPIVPRPHVPDFCLQQCSRRASSLAFPVPRPAPARTPPEEHKSPQKLDRHNNLHNDIF